MNVLVIPNIPLSYMRGGLETQMSRTIAGLKSLGVHVKVLNFEDSTLISWADLIHVFGIHNTFLAEGAAVRKPTVISSVFYQHSGVKRAILKGLSFMPKTEPNSIRRLLDLVRMVLPNSHSEKEQMRSLFGVPEERFRVVFNGIDLPAHIDQPSLSDLCTLPEIFQNNRFVLSAHRIEWRKNTLGLVEACGKANLPLLIVGSIGEKTQNEYQRKALEAIDKYPSVQYLGPLEHDKLQAVYMAAHVHALPSFMETPGLSSLEAGALGCNLVVGNCPPVREYFDGLGWIVEQDVRSIQAGLVQAIEAERNCFGQSELIKQKYTWSNAAEQTLAAYNEVLNEK